jgi:hypothetical protein
MQATYIHIGREIRTGVCLCAPPVCVCSCASRPEGLRREGQLEEAIQLQRPSGRLRWEYGFFTFRNHQIEPD